MKLPGLNRPPRRTSSDNYAKWGWYAMAVIVLLWILYNIFYR
ncbi:hypothetical protein [Hymenobacter sp. DG25B]|nr:hypothetical protein [Hymenobacter sp. DG25B]